LFGKHVKRDLNTSKETYTHQKICIYFKKDSWNIFAPCAVELTVDLVRKIRHRILILYMKRHAKKIYRFIHINIDLWAIFVPFVKRIVDLGRKMNCFKRNLQT